MNEELNKEIDFSHFPEKGHKSKSEVSTPTAQRLRAFPWKGSLVIVILIGLAGTLWYLLTASSQSQEFAIPAGYHWVSSKDAPPGLEKINP